MKLFPRRRLVAWLLLPALFLLAGALGANPLARTHAQAVGTVTVTKALQNSAGQAVQGDLSGYVFVLTSGAQSFTMAATTAQGQTSLGVPAGNYTISEQPRAGSTIIDFRIANAPIGGFTVTVGQTVAITATNLVGGNARVDITKRIVDSTGTLLAVQPADLSGFQFTLAGPGGFSQTVTTDVTGAVSVTNLGTGTYTITEIARSGYTISSLIVNNSVFTTNTAQFFVSTSGTTAVQAFDRVGTATGSVLVTKQIVDANGNPVPNADRSGFGYTIQCGSGTTATTQSGTTDATGTVTITAVPAGACVITEQPKPGFTPVSMTLQSSATVSATTGTPITTGGAITVVAGQTLSILSVNRQGAAGNTVVVTKQIVDANGNQVASADRSGFSFTLTCGSAPIPTQTTGTDGTTTFSGVPTGNCSIAEGTRAGFTLVAVLNGTSDITSNPAFAVSAGQAVSLTVRNRQGGQTESIPLVTGCNNQSLTWPNGTSTATVVQGVNPTTAVVAVWKFDPSAGRFLGYSTIVGAPNDLLSVNRLDAVFICLNAPATLTRPAV